MKLRHLTPLLGLVLGLSLTTGLAACSGAPGGDPSAAPTAPESSPAATQLPTPDPAETPASSADPQDPESTPTPTPEPIIASTNLDGITVSGGLGAKPTVSFATPWAIDKSRNKTLSPGTGANIPTAGLVRLNYIGINGRTGEVFDNSYDRGTSVGFDLSYVVTGFAKGLVGQRVGSRVLLAMPGSDGYDGSDQTSIGIEEGDSLIFVVDLIDTQLTEPKGSAVPPVAGLPLVGGEVAKPTLSLPADAKLPAGLLAQTIIQGEGYPVDATAVLLVNYTEYAWTPNVTGNQALRFIRQTYGYQPLRGYLYQTIPGWQQGLTGVAQGSRMLLVVPPDLAYPKGNDKIGVKADEWSVFLVDVLFA